MKKPKPVEVQEVIDAVLKALTTSFGNRPLSRDVAVQGLSQAAFEVNMAHIREVAEKGKKG